MQPADPPFQESTKVEQTINLRTAKLLGLTVPLPLLGDEAIELGCAMSLIGTKLTSICTATIPPALALTGIDPAVLTEMDPLN